MPARRKRCSICGQLHNIEDLRKFEGSNELVCTHCINSSGGNYVECAECHQVLRAYQHFDINISSDDMFEADYRADVTEVNERQICDNCLQRLYIRCEGCREYIRKRDAIEIDGSVICRSCSNNYVECDICHRRVLQANLQSVNHGEQHVCSNCARSFRRCSICNELVSESNVRLDTHGRQICTECREGYIECNDCHRLIEVGQEHTVDEDGDPIEPICDRCFNIGGESVIHGYHQGEPFVKRMADDDDVFEELFFGLELEVNGEKRYARKFLKLFEPNMIQLMNDSSVNGFEIITMPMTYKFLMDKFVPQLKVGLQFLIDKGFRGHNFGGLHIHVSEEAITKCQAAQLGEILYGNNNDKETWERISQRKKENLHWCSLNGSRRFYDITDDVTEKPNVATSRHTALNHDSTRTHTYEFRIFNSSLRIDRILKNVECVVALLDYTSKYKNKDRPMCHTSDFLEYVVARKIFYPNLNNFLEEKHILEQHKSKDFSMNDTENELEVA